MPRELLKFREGDCGLKIKKDGALEVAGVDEAGGMIDKEGKVNPALLFAAAWARKDQKVFEALIQNFKDAVAEGFFGNEAQADYKKALKTQAEHSKSLQDQNIAVKQDAPFMKPEETAEYKKSVTMSPASGAVTFEKPVDEGATNEDK